MEITTLLQNNTLKKTKSRVAVLEIITKHQAPIDVETLQKKLKEKNISVDTATVYRILGKFVQNKIIDQIEFQEGKFRYELSSLPHHHHAVCTSCGKVEDIESCNLDSLEKNIEKTLQFQVNSHRADFFGLCNLCTTYT